VPEELEHVRGQDGAEQNQKEDGRGERWRIVVSALGRKVLRTLVAGSVVVIGGGARSEVHQVRNDGIENRHPRNTLLRVAVL
jgi:hypothetical protein